MSYFIRNLVNVVIKLLQKSDQLVIFKTRENQNTIGS